MKENIRCYYLASFPYWFMIYEIRRNLNINSYTRLRIFYLFLRLRHFHSEMSAMHHGYNKNMHESEQSNQNEFSIILCYRPIFQQNAHNRILLLFLFFKFAQKNKKKPEHWTFHCWKEKQAQRNQTIQILNESKISSANTHAFKNWFRIYMYNNIHNTNFRTHFTLISCVSLVNPRSSNSCKSNKFSH